MKKLLMLTCTLLFTVTGLAASWNIQEKFGLPIFPGAESKPEVARAVEAYYRPGISKTQNITVGVFETPVPFDKAYDFYGPRMDPGKWGWRKKARVLQHHTETLKFMRTQLLAGQGKEENRLPDVYRPLFGDPNLRQSAFAAKLDKLLKENKHAKIETVEGTLMIPGDPARSQVRVTIERPYIDLNKMKLIDKTRIVMVKVS
jgi:hypothetical protein